MPFATKTLCASILIAGCAGSSAPLAPRHVAKLQGPAYRDFFAELPALVDKAYRAMRETLGLPPQPPPEIPVIVTSAGARHDPGRCGSFWGDHVVARTVWRSGQSKTVPPVSMRRAVGATSHGSVADRIGIVICLDKLVRSALDPRGLLRHEVAHVVTFRELGPYARRLPAWFQEGLAELLGGDGHARVRRVLAWNAAVPKIVGIAALGERRALRGRYFECYLHVRFLLERAGAGALAKAFDLLRQGRSLMEAVQALTGLGPEEYMAASTAWVQRTIGEVAVASGHDAFRAAVGVAKDAGAAKGIAALRAFLGEHERSAYESRARYLIARLLLQEKRFEEARAELGTFLAAEPEPSWAALYLQARVLAHADPCAARDILLDLIESSRTRAADRQNAERLLKSLEPKLSSTCAGAAKPEKP
jgi:hypothetical protein